MCGITGFWTEGIRGDQAIGALARMTDSIAHRGPDDSGSWFDDACGIALGHRRLSIVDLSPLGHQPMASASGRFTLVYNGEIYNFRALRAELARCGTTFRGGSDTEVLLALVERHGLSDALVRCTGMFAIALWDSHERTLQLARDRFGEKPLYYAQVANGMAFGSELTPVRRAPGFVGTIDRDAVTAFLRHGYINAPGAIFTEVRKLEPGSVATFTGASGTPTIRRYWSLEDVAREGAEHPSTASDEHALDAFERLLGDAIGDQMIADVPLGAFLSGGVDSSLVVALMQKRATRPVRTFTIGFEDKKFDEATHAEAVARHLGTEHTTMYVRAQDALDLIPRLPDIYDEPFADSSQIPTALVAALARQHVTVALSGDGGDELFGGYSRYGSTIEIWKRLRHMPASVRRVAADAVTSVGADRWDRALRPLGLSRQGITGDRLHKLADLFGSRDSSRLYRDLVSAWRDPGQLVKGARAATIDARPPLRLAPRACTSFGRISSADPSRTARTNCQQTLCSDHEYLRQISLLATRQRGSPAPSLPSAQPAIPDAVADRV